MSKDGFDVIVYKALVLGSAVLTGNTSVSSTLSLFHDDQFWVGIVEHVEGGNLGVARIIFGAEPSNEEILHFAASRWEKLSLVGRKEPGKPKLASKDGPAKRIVR